MPSTVIDHFSYNPESKALKITFVSGNVYVYQDVPEHIYRSMKISGSKGKYFNHFIKDKYSFEKLDNE